jgi:hypothetical protein
MKMAHQIIVTIVTTIGMNGFASFSIIKAHFIVQSYISFRVSDEIACTHVAP